MIISKILSNYINIPNKIMNCVGPFYNMIPIEKRFGKTFSKTRKRLEYYERMDNNQIRSIQNELFMNTVKHAYNHVPYYNNLFNEFGISLQEIQSVNDITLIPFLTKEILREKKNELIADDVSEESLHWITTSGTTGQAIGFYLDSDMSMKDWAWGTYLYQRVGWQDNCSKLMLRGKTFYNKIHGKSWQYDAFKRELSVDIFQMDNAHMEIYCKAIERYRPDNIFGYMSAILTLCKYIEFRGSIKHHFSGVYACSEMVLEEQRNYVEKILNVRVFSNYGMSEKVILAGECEDSHEYHVEPLYGVTEIVDENGSVIEDGRVGELVGTGFNSMGMPLIRYKTGDLASWSTKKECQCGRTHKRISKIEGRWKNDYLVGKDGTKIYLSAINMHSDIFDKITKYQFEQRKIGEVTLKLCSLEALKKEDINKIKLELKAKFRKNIDIQIEVVNDIELSKSGKYKIIQQNLNT